MARSASRDAGQVIQNMERVQKWVAQSELSEGSGPRFWFARENGLLLDPEHLRYVLYPDVNRQ